MVGVSASVNLPLHHKVQKFSSGTGSPGWSRKKGRKTVVVWFQHKYGCIRDEFMVWRERAGIKGKMSLLSGVQECVKNGWGQATGWGQSLRFLQCIDTVGSVRGRTCGLWKTNGSYSERVQEEALEMTDPRSLEKRPSKWRCCSWICQNAIVFDNAVNAVRMRRWASPFWPTYCILGNSVVLSSALHT